LNPDAADDDLQKNAGRPAAAGRETTDDFYRTTSICSPEKQHHAANSSMSVSTAVQERPLKLMEALYI
jgi:hypothetical protein